MEQRSFRTRSWRHKFRNAFRGMAVGARGQNSFVVHTFCAVSVVVVAALARLNAWRWCTLLLCIVIVLMAEMFNSSLEVLSRSISSEHDPRLRDALDIASGAVLLAAIGSVVVGAIAVLSAWPL